MRHLLFIAFLLFSANYKAQTYSYSFSGSASNETTAKLTEEIGKMPQVKSCKILYKPEKNIGQIIYQITPIIHTSEERDESKEFSVVLIKQLLLKHSLSPMSNEEINY
jgi:hypothetical protein